MDEASTAASTEANTRVRRCLAYASSQRAREDELGKWASGQVGKWASGQVGKVVIRWTRKYIMYII